MTSAPWRDQRFLIPRWRRLTVTSATAELAIPKAEDEPVDIGAASTEFDEKLSRWRESPTLVTAAELVGAALVEARESEVVDAARLLTARGSTATVLLRRLAERCVNRARPRLLSGSAQIPDYGSEKRVWRHRVRLHPRSALAWVELSLLDIVGGRESSALRSMLVALQLAPTNRHVLRSAARLFLQLRDPQRAYDVIAKSDRIRRDPWLVAAELSLAALAMRNPRHFGLGRRLILDGDVVPRQFTELAGAIGTLELIAGNQKNARAFFRKSVIAPTGNALAQAEWAAPTIGIDLAGKSFFALVTEIDEARAFQLLNAESFSQVPDACRDWSQAEPYSIRPYEISSSASALVEDHHLTLKTARSGLMIRQKSYTLLNNSAFALASLGQFAEAERILRRIGAGAGRHWSVSEANRGLLAMRKGQYDVGITHYRRAIRDFRGRGEGRSADIAFLYMAREAALAELPDAGKLVERARELAGRLGTNRYDHVLAQAAKALVAKRQLASTTRQRGQRAGS